MLAESLVALATAGSTALVGAMATDAWQATRTGVLRLFGRAHTGLRDGTVAQPDDGTAPEGGGPETMPAADGQIALVAAQLDGDAALVARAGDAAAARRSLLPGWQLRLQELLRAHPELAGELTELTERMRRSLPADEQRWVMHVAAHDHAQVFAAQGGDVIVHQEPGGRA
ncbi:hypothetical protein [Kitasatospora sp. NPDC058218]|uniref:hypothetical protein n=1 Tax=Kitasatospora sp. NPDC058218 TaxID=3346385 RepID=UPI0036D8AC95